MKAVECISTIRFLLISTFAVGIGANSSHSHIVDLTFSNVEDVVFDPTDRGPWIVAAYYGPCYNCVYDSLTLIFLALNLNGK